MRGVAGAGGGARVAGPGERRPCALGSSVYTAAHEDDSFLYEGPDLYHDIASGRCVETVFVTAGDSGLSEAYWRGRERGVEAAYAEIAGVPDTWTTSDAGIPGHPMARRTLVAKPTVSLVFMRIPDGNWVWGTGFPSTGYVSLQHLWEGTLPTITAIDGSSTYSRQSLIDTLRALILNAGADHLATQNFEGSFGDGDHSDHHAIAFFTKAAGELDPAPHTLTGYVGYQMATWPPNLGAEDTAAKEAAWWAYAPYDPAVCQSKSECLAAGHGTSWTRQYVAATIQQGTLPPSPLVSGLYPASGPADTTATVDASGFLPSHLLTVTVGGSTANVSAGATTDAHGNATITFTIPSLHAGAHAVTVSDGTNTAATSFTTTPALSEPHPTNGPAGTTVTIDASGFLGSHALTVAVGGTTAKAAAGATTAANGSTTITFEVPSLRSGAHAVTVSDGTNTITAATPFTTAASVSGQHPTSGPPRPP